MPEIQVGGELEVDHFQPVRYNGADTLDNLVYACTICNRFKSDYWPAADSPEGLRLLHPGQDDMSAHVNETAEGWLIGLTPRGWFHIDRLHLNRPQLVAMRQLAQVGQSIQQEIDQAQDSNAQLQKRIHTLEIELAELREIIAGLSD